MMLSHHFLRLFLILTALMIAGCAGLSNEPQIVATLPPVIATQAPAEVPTAPPDITNGARLYAAHCASCHGVGGEGNGELVTSGQLNIEGEVIHPPSFKDPNTARDQRPQEWFTTISNGRIERLMPPWANALTEQERWDVAYYTYTMHYTQEQIARGRELWEIECVDCHGLEGRGDGSDASEQREQVEDLTDQRSMALASDKVFYNFINEGSAEAMPAFGEDYTEEQLWDMVAYSRTLSLANSDSIGQTLLAAEPTNAAPVDQASATLQSTGTITGSISNGTAGGSVPDSLEVTLFLVDAQGNNQKFETVSDGSGNFSFDDIPMRDDLTYFAATSYRERPFSTGVAGGTAGMELPITIYELTEDPSVINIVRLAHQVTAVADGLQVTQISIFRNTSDRLFTSGRTVGENLYASLFITLPPGAAVIGFPEGQGRYIISDDQSTVIDTVGVLPQQDHLMQVIYFIPYAGSAIIEQPMNYDLDGMVVLLLRPQTLMATSEQLPSMGPQLVGETTYAGYGAELSLNAGDVIRYELNGAGVSSVTQLEPQAVTSNNLIIIVVLVVVGVGVLIGVIYRLNHRSADETKNDKQALMDAVLRQIDELDQAEARGEINHDLYHHQRKQLKARLAELIDDRADRN